MAINQNEARNKEAKLHYIRASYFFSKIFSQEDSTLGLNLTHLSISTDTSKKSWFFSQIKLPIIFIFYEVGMKPSVSTTHACCQVSKKLSPTRQTRVGWFMRASNETSDDAVSNYKYSEVICMCGKEAEER